MFQGFNSTKIWASALLLTLITLFVGLLLGLRVAQQRAEHVLLDKVERRGWAVKHTPLKINLSGRARIDEICLSFHADAHQDVCVQDLMLQLRPMALIRKHIHIQELRATSVHIDSTLNRLRALRPSADDDDETGRDDAENDRRFPVLKRAHIERIDVRVAHAEHSLHLALTDIQARPDHGATRIQANGELLSFEGGSDAWTQSLKPLMRRSFSIDLAGSLEERLQEASLRFDERLTLRMPGEKGMELSLDAVGFDAPYTIRMHAPVVHSTDPAFTLHAKEIETNVGVWTRHLPNFYFSSLKVHTPTLSMRSQDISAILSSIAARFTPEDDKEEAVGENGEPDEDRDDAPDASTDDDTPKHASATERKTRSAFGDLLAQLTHERTWWEVLPRAIEIHDGSVHLRDAHDDVLRLQNIEASYAVRVLHQQMDVEFDADVLHNDAPAGTLDGRLEWNYTSQIGRLFWDIEDLSLESFHALAPTETLRGVSGLFESEGRWRINKKHHISGEHRTALKNLRVHHPRFTEDIEIPSLSIAGSFDHTSIRAHDASQNRGDNPEDAPEKHAAPWVLKDHVLQVGDQRAMLQVEFSDVRPFQRPRVQSVFIDLEIPKQPAMALFETIPKTIRGPLREAKMQGEWGLRLAFEIDHTGRDDQGRPTWEIRSPSTYRVDDSNLALISLPEAVDVQRLNGEMEFVFRGPDDGFMRPIRIPSPAKAKEIALQYQEDSDDQTQTVPERSSKAKATHPWVPLQAMSFYFIATQLYREDGSFFRNSGINWLQIRHVLSDALTTGKVSRGASTITMQTVKNLFLTHEKSAERKLQELFLTYWMTRTVPKDRILEVYLNVIELCPHCNGADEASRFHFDTPIGDLDIRSAVWLSTISPNPTRLGGKKPKKTVGFKECTRCDQILRGLHARGWINAREFRKGTVDPEPPPADVVADSPRDTLTASDALDTENTAERIDADAALGDADRTEETHETQTTPSQNLPWFSDSLDALEEEPPLLDMLDEFEEDSSDFERMSVDERLKTWIEEQRPLRGPN